MGVPIASESSGKGKELLLEIDSLAPENHKGHLADVSLSSNDSLSRSRRRWRLVKIIGKLNPHLIEEPRKLLFYQTLCVLLSILLVFLLLHAILFRTKSTEPSGLPVIDVPILRSSPPESIISSLSSSSPSSSSPSASPEIPSPTVEPPSDTEFINSLIPSAFEDFEKSLEPSESDEFEEFPDPPAPETRSPTPQPTDLLAKMLSGFFSDYIFISSLDY